MNINPNMLQMAKNLAKSNGNIEQMAFNSVFGKNPILKELFRMMKSGDQKSVENFARNICKERGIDYDKEYPDFVNKLKDSNCNNYIKK